MKKLFTILCTLALGGALAVAQASTGGQSTSTQTTSTTTTKTTKKHKHHKAAKKAKKGAKTTSDSGASNPK